MSSTTSNNTAGPPLITGIPTGIVPYLMIIAALVSTAVHFWLTPMIIEFDTMQAILFVLAGIGFIGGIIVYAGSGGVNSIFLPHYLPLLKSLHTSS